MHKLNTFRHSTHQMYLSRHGSAEKCDLHSCHGSVPCMAIASPLFIFDKVPQWEFRQACTYQLHRRKGFFSPTWHKEGSRCQITPQANTSLLFAHTFSAVPLNPLPCLRWVCGQDSTMYYVSSKPPHEIITANSSFWRSNREVINKTKR